MGDEGFVEKMKRRIIAKRSDKPIIFGRKLVPEYELVVFFLFYFVCFLGPR